MIRKTIIYYLSLKMAFQFAISFITATYVIFLISRGLNLFEVNLVNMTFFATMFLFEIPTGAVADVFGRKVSFVASCFLFALGMFMYSMANSFWGFAAAEITSAIGATLASGAFQAWLVDRIKHYGYEDSLSPIFAKQQYVTGIAGIVGALCGAFLADKNIVLPWIVGGSLMIVVGITAAILMKEEYFVKKKFSFKSGFQAMGETIRVSTQYGFKNKAVRFLLAISMMQFFAVQAPNMQWQPFFSQFLSSKTSLGFIWTGMAVFMMIGAAIAPRLIKKGMSEKKAILMTQGAVGVGILSTTYFGLPVALAIFLLHEIARGTYYPLQEMYLHDNIPSQQRATLVSLDSMFHHLGGMIGLLMFGFIGEYVSITAAWSLSGVLLLCSVGLFWRNGRK